MSVHTCAWCSVKRQSKLCFANIIVGSFLESTTPSTWICFKYKMSSKCPIIFVLWLWPEISAAKWSKLILDYLYPSKLDGGFKYFFIFPERRFVAGFFRRLLAYLPPHISHTYLTPHISYTYPSHRTYPTHIHSKRIVPIRIPPMCILSKRLHQQVCNTYPSNTYPTSTYPCYAYPFNAYPFKRCASAGIVNVSHQYISHQYISHTYPTHIHSKRNPPIRIPPIRIRSTRIPPVRIHAMRIRSMRIHSKGVHQQESQTYPTNTYPTNTYLQHVSHQYGSIQCVSIQKVCISRNGNEYEYHCISFHTIATRREW